MWFIIQRKCDLLLSSISTTTKFAFLSSREPEFYAPQNMFFKIGQLLDFDDLCKSSFFLGPRPLVLPLVTQSPWSRRHPRHHANQWGGDPKICFGQTKFSSGSVLKLRENWSNHFFDKEILPLNEFFRHRIFSFPPPNIFFSFKTMEYRMDKYAHKWSKLFHFSKLFKFCLWLYGKFVTKQRQGDFCWRVWTHLQKRMIYMSFWSYCRSRSRKWALTWK